MAGGHSGWWAQWLLGTVAANNADGMKLETASKLFVLLLASEAIYTDIGTIGIYIYINPETCMVGVDLYIATWLMKLIASKQKLWNMVMLFG